MAYKMKTDVIIIKGAPGSGKSETAEILSAHFKKSIKIEADIVRSMIVSVDWMDLRDHVNTLNIAADMTLKFLQYDYKPVIIIDTFSCGKIKGFTDILYKSCINLSVKIFSLHVKDDELKKRLKSRKDDKFKDFLLSKEVNDDIIKLKTEDEIIIDTTGKTAKDTADEIFNILEK